jgi:hypothetical protein
MSVIQQVSEYDWPFESLMLPDLPDDTSLFYDKLRILVEISYCERLYAGEFALQSPIRSQMLHVLLLREAMNICPHSSISSNRRLDGGQGQNVEESSVSLSPRLIALSIW